MIDYDSPEPTDHKFSQQHIRKLPNCLSSFLMLVKRVRSTSP